MNENDFEEENENNINENEIEIDSIGDSIIKDLRLYKVIIIGDSKVGKTSISYRALKNEFNENISSNIISDVQNYKISVNNQNFIIQLWDNCVNEDFDKYTPNLFNNVSIAILVYSINNKKSFENISIWNNILYEHCFDCIKFLIGSKNDLEEERQVQKEEGEKIKNEFNFSYFFETSSKNGLNIKFLLNNIAISLYEKFRLELTRIPDSISITKHDFRRKTIGKRKKCC